MNKIGSLLAIIALVSLVTSGGCSTAPKSEGDATKLAANAKASLEGYKAKDPSLQALLDKSVGYAIFPDIGKAGWIVGGSYGRGEVFEAGNKIGYADIKEVSAGFQWGAQNFSELLLFMKQDELDKFKKGEFSVGANVSAVALTAGAAGKTDPNKGVIALVDTKGGLMAEAAVGGQRMKFQPLSEVPPATQPSGAK
jgi:lipid-binding SYLF domain-containing protein